VIRTKDKAGTLESRLTIGSRAGQMASKALLRGLPLLPSDRLYRLTISRERKFVWFRVPKVGTRTLFEVFDRAGVILDARHTPFCHYPPARYTSFFKFAFVRNPWDRLVSCWYSKVVEQNHFGFSRERHLEMQSFPNFVRFVSGFDLANCDPHLRLQSALIDLNYVDFVGRFERFEQDLRLVLDAVGVEADAIPKENVSKNPRSLHEYHDEKLAREVGRLYARDIGIFGYEWGASRPPSPNSRT
jgi:hypothetical protein